MVHVLEWDVIQMQFVTKKHCLVQCAFVDQATKAMEGSAQVEPTIWS